MGQVFVEVGEATANVPHIQSVVKAEFGANYQLVTNDGLELHDNTGIQGKGCQIDVYRDRKHVLDTLAD